MINVLIVEDDPMVRDINEKFLGNLEGFKKHKSVNSIEKAKLEIINNNNIDLILLDIFFPQGKGIELLRWLRNESYKCDVILITADRSSETIEEALRYGAVDYLVKPFVFNRFKEALMFYKNRKDMFANDTILQQDMIDKYTFQEKSNSKSLDDDFRFNKGFNEHTYRKILDGIEAMKGKTFTAQDIGKMVGVSRITARRYLDYLEKENRLEIELEYGKVGRPKNKYRVLD